MKKIKESPSYESAVQACYSTWSESYYEEYYGVKAPYPPVHRDIIIQLLRKARVKNVIDAGCGPASFLRELKGMGIARYGFDLTPEMVSEGDRVLMAQGEPPRAYMARKCHDEAIVSSTRKEGATL